MDHPCVTGDSFVAGFAHQVTADAGADVKAFTAYAEWFKDQALDDGHQQETLDASLWIVSRSIPLATVSSRTTALLSTRRVPCARRLFYCYTATKGTEKRVLSFCSETARATVLNRTTFPRRTGSEGRVSTCTLQMSFSVVVFDQVQYPFLSMTHDICSRR